MGHPDRRAQRAKKKKEREEMLKRRNFYNVLDLTPYNVVGKLKYPEEFCCRYK
ncbi:MAG: hypothetical protein GX044_10925 [Firmicutes bacterium]|nr:hypothetical protein [Bacillota bacterium]